MLLARISKCGWLVKTQLRSVVLKNRSGLLFTSTLSDSLQDNSASNLIVSSDVKSASYVDGFPFVEMKSRKQFELTEEQLLSAYKIASEECDVVTFTELLSEQNRCKIPLRDSHPTLGMMKTLMESHVSSKIRFDLWLRNLGELGVKHSSELEFFSSLVYLTRTHELTATETVNMLVGLTKSNYTVNIQSREISIEKRNEMQSIILKHVQNAIIKCNKTQFHDIVRALGLLHVHYDNLHEFTQKALFIQLQKYSSVLTKQIRPSGNIIQAFKHLNMHADKLTSSQKELLFEFCTDLLTLIRNVHLDKTHPEHNKRWAYTRLNNVLTSLVSFHFSFADMPLDLQQSIRETYTLFEPEFEKNQLQIIQGCLKDLKVPSKFNNNGEKTLLSPSSSSSSNKQQRMINPVAVTAIKNKETRKDDFIKDTEPLPSILDEARRAPLKQPEIRTKSPLKSSTISSDVNSVKTSASTVKDIVKKHVDDQAVSSLSSMVEVNQSSSVLKDSAFPIQEKSPLQVYYKKSSDEVYAAWKARFDELRLIENRTAEEQLEKSRLSNVIHTEDIIRRNTTDYSDSYKRILDKIYVLHVNPNRTNEQEIKYRTLSRRLRNEYTNMQNKLVNKGVTTNVVSTNTSSSADLSTSEILSTKTETSDESVAVKVQHVPSEPGKKVKHVHPVTVKSIPIQSVPVQSVVLSVDVLLVGDSLETLRNKLTAMEQSDISSIEDYTKLLVAIRLAERNAVSNTPEVNIVSEVEKTMSMAVDEVVSTQVNDVVGVSTTTVMADTQSAVNEVSIAANSLVTEALRETIQAPIAPEVSTADVIDNATLAAPAVVEEVTDAVIDDSTNAVTVSESHVVSSSDAITAEPVVTVASTVPVETNLEYSPVSSTSSYQAILPDLASLEMTKAEMEAALTAVLELRVAKAAVMKLRAQVASEAANVAVQMSLKEAESLSKVLIEADPEVTNEMTANIENVIVNEAERSVHHIDEAVVQIGAINTLEVAKPSIDSLSQLTPSEEQAAEAFSEAIYNKSSEATASLQQSVESVAKQKMSTTLSNEVLTPVVKKSTVTHSISPDGKTIRTVVTVTETKTITETIESKDGEIKVVNKLSKKQKKDARNKEKKDKREHKEVAETKTSVVVDKAELISKSDSKPKESLPKKVSTSDVSDAVSAVSSVTVPASKSSVNAEQNMSKTPVTKVDKQPVATDLKPKLKPVVVNVTKKEIDKIKAKLQPQLPDVDWRSLYSGNTATNNVNEEKLENNEKVLSESQITSAAISEFIDSKQNTRLTADERKEIHTMIEQSSDCFAKENLSRTLNQLMAAYTRLTPLLTSRILECFSAQDSAGYQLCRESRSLLQNTLKCLTNIGLTWHSFECNHFEISLIQHMNALNIAQLGSIIKSFDTMNVKWSDLKVDTVNALADRLNGMENKDYKFQSIEMLMQHLPLMCSAFRFNIDADKRSTSVTADAMQEESLSQVHTQSLWRIHEVLLRAFENLKNSKGQQLWKYAVAHQDGRTDLRQNTIAESVANYVTFIQATPQGRELCTKVFGHAETLLFHTAIVSTESNTKLLSHAYVNDKFYLYCKTAFEEYNNKKEHGQFKLRLDHTVICPYPLNFRKLSVFHGDELVAFIELYDDKKSRVPQHLKDLKALRKEINEAYYPDVLTYHCINPSAVVGIPTSGQQNLIHSLIANIQKKDKARNTATTTTVVVSSNDVVEDDDFPSSKGGSGTGGGGNLTSPVSTSTSTVVSAESVNAHSELNMNAVPATRASTSAVTSTSNSEDNNESIHSGMLGLERSMHTISVLSSTPYVNGLKRIRLQDTSKIRPKLTPLMVVKASKNTVTVTRKSPKAQQQQYQYSTSSTAVDDLFDNGFYSDSHSLTEEAVLAESTSL